MLLSLSIVFKSNMYLTLSRHLFTIERQEKLYQVRNVGKKIDCEKNQFKFLFTVSLTVNFGLRQDGSTIWVSSNVYSTNNSWSGNPYTGPIIAGISGGKASSRNFLLNIHHII
jgi:hypothetical protein